MQLQFPKKSVSCLQRVKAEMQALEETQELRIPEEMPDIGKVLGAWGQVLLRSKQWREGSMILSGGVVTWVLYQPEGDLSQPQTVEAWIPFQMKCDLPETKRDGTIRVSPLLKSVDARSTTARKMVARVTVNVLAEAYVQDAVEICTPEEIPEDVQLLCHTYPMQLPKEAGEKEFSLEEELMLPASAPKIERIVHFSFHPELIDRKVLSGKIVFRGIGLLHLLYLDENGQLCTWDGEVPFSQYAQLDEVYEQEADARVLPVLTGMELDTISSEKLSLKASLIGQYVIYDTQLITLAQDAYSPTRDVEMTVSTLKLPALLESRQQTIHVESSIRQEVGKIADIVFYPDQVRVQQNSNEANLELSGIFQVLFQDPQGVLHGVISKWREQQKLLVAPDVRIEVTAIPSGLAKADLIPGEIHMERDILLDSVTSTSQGIPMVTQLELGQIRTENESRPSLILRRAGGGTFWDLAKKYGSTMERIKKANHLEEMPDDNRMLLIPIL